MNFTYLQQTLVSLRQNYRVWSMVYYLTFPLNNENINCIPNSGSKNHIHFNNDVENKKKHPFFVKITSTYCQNYCDSIFTCCKMAMYLVKAIVNRNKVLPTSEINRKVILGCQFYDVLSPNDT